MSGRSEVGPFCLEKPHGTLLKHVLTLLLIYVQGRYDVDHRTHEPDDALKKVQTAGSISISPELFEKIYLSPQNKVKGDIRQTFGNPTPM